MSKIERLKKLIQNMPILDANTKNLWLEKINELSDKKLEELISLFEESYRKLSLINKNFNLKLIDFNNTKILPAIHKREKTENDAELKESEDILNQL